MEEAQEHPPIPVIDSSRNLQAKTTSENQQDSAADPTPPSPTTKHEDESHKKWKDVSRKRLAWAVLTSILSVADLVTDIIVVVQFFRVEANNLAGLSLGFMLLSAVVQLCSAFDKCWCVI